MRSLIQKLLIARYVRSYAASFNEWNLSILIELRLLVRVYESVAVTSLAREIVLVGKAPEAILLILPLHLMNLSLQICDFLLFSILLTDTVRIDLYIIP